MRTMSMRTALSDAGGGQRGALLLWMIFTGLTVFAAIVLWRYGLIRLMLVSDRTYISSLIAVLYVITAARSCLRWMVPQRLSLTPKPCLPVS
jgi:hypothetical protein